jgi:hypothetical protein
MRSFMTCLLFAAAFTATAEVQNHRVDPDTGIETWETSAHGVTVSLTQILPDQARAFYINRGFSAEAAEIYATACVYMTVLRNDTAPGIVSFRLADWSVVSGRESNPPVSYETWVERLGVFSPTKPAMIALRWAQFPPEQSYEPGGDWNQGMLTTGLEPGATFDLVARWTVGDNNYEGVLKNVQCAR